MSELPAGQEAPSVSGSFTAAGRERSLETCLNVVPSQAQWQASPDPEGPVLWELTVLVFQKVPTR